MTSHKLQQIFQELKIPTQEGSSGAVNCHCPFDHSRGGKSGQPDTKFRCGVWPSTMRFHCLRCKRTGSLFSLLQKATRITSDEFKRLVGVSTIPAEESLSDTLRGRLSTPTELIKPVKEVILPFCNPITDRTRQPSVLTNFLNDRNITIETCQDYGLMYSGNIGPDAYRLIIPLYDELGELVAWQGRDVTDRLKTKYHTKGYITDHLYWTNKMERPFRIFLVEGVFDVIRMNSNSVCCFTHGLSKRQRTMLMDAPMISELVICWDGDSYDLALGEARQLAPILRRVGVVRMPEGEDPDSLGSETVRDLKVRWI